MKTFLTLVLLVSAFAANSQDQIYFVSDPSPSPDGQTIFFSYQSDLWKVATSGGEAIRITAMDGIESLASVSPDGKWIAFSSNQLGNNDIYIMPAGGGDIQQLTYHDSNDEMESWSWDSQTLYFTSNRYNRYSTYSLKVTGGTPKREFQHYFNNVHNAFPHPDGRLFFNETWESKNFAHRKRYKGAYNPDIKSYDKATSSYRQYTDYEGKDFWASIDQNGNIYFVSDEANDEYNLYQLENDQKKQLTDFKTSVIRPRVSADGSVIVFTKDYQLFTYQTASGNISPVNISLTRTNVLSQDKEFDVKNNISSFDIAPDKKKMAFISRGELFVGDVKGKFIRHIPTMDTERLMEVFWLADSRRLLYSRSNNGYFNWYVRNADGSGNERQLTNDSQNNRNLSMDSKRTKAIYLSGRNELRLMDLNSLTSSTIINDEFWALYNPSILFSPDDRYILFTAIRNFERDVFVYDMNSKASINITNTGVTETSPSWSPDGKYIYFSSNLTEPSYPRGGGDNHLYRVPVSLFDDPFKSQKIEELFKEEAKEEESSSKKKKKKESPVVEDENKKSSVSFSIDPSFKFMENIERVGPGFGNQSGAIPLKDGEDVNVYYFSNHDEGTTKLWKTTFSDFERPKTEKVSDERINGFSLVRAGDSYYALINGNINTFNASSGKTEKLDISYKFQRSLSQEFTQMFYEAWAGFEENYYDENFHGQDWQSLRDRYAKYIPYITSRADLRRVFNDMLGELNTSHFGFSSNGEEEETFYGNTSIGTGIKFEENEPFKVEGIISDSPAEKANAIKKGDLLIAVNGIRINQEKNRESYFSSTSVPEEITLTFSRGGQNIDVNLHPARSGSIRMALYDEWVDNNQDYVDSKASKKIAYVHMKNMGEGELQNFLREMVSEADSREALILDLRYNTGGNVHDDVLRFLSQKPYMNWKYREGALSSQSNFSPASKPIVMLINEQSLSDAEVTSSGFKELGLGKIVGTETYRWIIFTSGKGLVDGSFYRLPSWGCYSLDGRDLEITGVSPDIQVEKGFVQRLNGEYPQLDRAIEEIMKELK